MALIFLLLVPLLSTCIALPAKAQDNPHEGIIKLWAPYNRTYTLSEPLHLYASLDIRYGQSNAYFANYTINDGVSQTIPKKSMNPQFWSVTYGALYIGVELPKLPIGQHKLTIYLSVNYTGKTSWLVSGEKKVYFTVSTTKTDDASITGGQVNIYSPSNKSCNANSIIPIHASASTIAVKKLNYTTTYCVDGKGPYKLQTNHFEIYQYDLYFGSVSAAGEINLPQGKHNITVYIKTCTQDSQNLSITREATVYFGVGDTNPPNITLSRIDGQVYNQTTIPLNFTLNESASWIAYSIDNGSPTAITANTTLTATNGDHTLVIYANDTAGNIGQSKEAHFTVQSQGSGLPVNVEAVSIAVLVVLVIAAAIVAIYQKAQMKRA